jgi:hypothetical protein
MGRFTWLFLLFCCWLGAGHVAAVTLRYNSKQGSTTRYTESISANLRTTSASIDPNQNVSAQLVLESRYREFVTNLVAPDGFRLERNPEVSTLKVVFPAGSAPLEFTLPDGKKQIRLTNRGLLRSVRLDTSGIRTPTGGNALRVFGTIEALLSHLPFSARDMKVGAAWKDTLYIPGLHDNNLVPVTITSRLLSLDILGGRSCARIRSSINLPLSFSPVDLAFLWDSAQPPSLTKNITGILTIRQEWFFDYNQGQLISAQGPFNFEAKLPVSKVGTAGKTGSGKPSLIGSGTFKISLLQ